MSIKRLKDLSAPDELEVTRARIAALEAANAEAACIIEKLLPCLMGDDGDTDYCEVCDMLQGDESPTIHTADCPVRLGREWLEKQEER